MSIPYLTTSGPSNDLEVFAYFRNEFPVLPDPQTLVPFHMQGQPIPDMFNKHTDALQVSMATSWHATNPLPYTRFVGTSQRQIHKPAFLSVNEDIYV